MDQAQTRQAPFGVQLLAILEYIAGAFYLIFGVIAFFRGDLFLRVMNYSDHGMALASGYPVVGLVAIVLGIVHVLLGGGLWNGKAWAYIWVVVISAAYVIVGIIALTTIGYANYVSFILNALVLIYLLASSDAKAYLTK